MTIDVLIDLEIGLVKAFGWSLHDIDETNVGSLIPFIGRLMANEGAGSRRVYVDEAEGF